MIRFVGNVATMAKTKPIGVRFDENVLEVLKEDEKCETPQQCLIFLCNFYIHNRHGQIDFRKEFGHMKFVKREGDERSMNIPKGFEDKVNALGREINKELMEQLTETVLSGTPTTVVIKDKSEMQKQISEIMNEKIPKERDTPLGRKVWYNEQQKRIEELKNPT